MNDKKFWKIIYLYITKYGYNILYYRPEKKDVWLINDDNELLRLIYSDSFKSTEVDSIVSNIIRNETRLKKMFRLSSLKVKVLCFSPEFDEIIADYKKYRISSSLSIERTLYNDNNKKLFIKEKDLRFIDATPDTPRYKNRVVELYKRNTLDNSAINFKFNLISIFYLLLFMFNYLVVYATNRQYSLYQYLEYNYQKIISGQFYRVFSDVFIEDNIKSLVLILVTVFISSILFNKNLNTVKAIATLVTASLVFNLFLIFGYGESLDIALLSNFAMLGSIFFEQLSKRNDNLRFMYISGLSLVYLILGVILFDESIVLYIFSFVLGVFVQLFLTKKRNLPILITINLVLCIAGGVVLFLGSPTKTLINDYRLNKIDERLLSNKTDEDIFTLERELNSKNRSILTYYELGMIKMTTSSKDDAKSVFLKGIEFDDSFAPIYYNLGLIEREEGNYSKSKEYAQKAYELEKKEQYKNLVDELNEY